MEDTYAIINIEGNWLENTVIWDGDTEKWNPPEGCKAVLLSEIDISSLKKNQNNILK